MAEAKTETKPKGQHGGFRPGAGRPPSPRTRSVRMDDDLAEKCYALAEWEGVPIGKLLGLMFRKTIERRYADMLFETGKGRDTA